MDLMKATANDANCGVLPHSSRSNCIDLYSSKKTVFTDLPLKPVYVATSAKEVKPQVIGEYWKVLLEVGGIYPRLADFQEPTMEDVKKMHHHPLLSIFYVRSPNGFIGEFTLEGHQGKSTLIHISFLPWIPLREKQQCGLQILDQVLNLWKYEGDHVVDTLVGIIPVQHRAAKLYSRLCGFKEIGVIPSGAYKAGVPTGGAIFVLEHDKQRREVWASQD